LSGLILEKAEGNPFFVEELLRSLIETGQLQPRDDRWQVVGEATHVSIPNTLAGVLGARIDRLPEDSRRALQVAAVIGRTFEPGLLAAAAAPLPRLEASLEQLLGSGLVVRLNGADGPRYMFRHALVQDAAYETILLKERRRLHGRVGETMEEMQAARLEELAPVLAQHFHAADDPRSLKYDTLAGEAAARLYANAEAAVHFGRAVETARRIAAPPARIGELFARWGNALEQCGRYEPALAAYDEMLAFARQQADPALELQALTAQAKVYSTFTSLHNPQLADQKLEQALELARRTGDRDTQTRLLWHLMLSCLFSKRLDQSLAHGERALALARESGQRENLAYVLNDLCRLHTCRGEFEKSHRVIREARELWRALDNQVMVADSLGSEGEAYFNACEYDKALEVLAQALSISERINNVWGQCYDRMLIAFVHFQTGRLDMGIPMAEQSVILGDNAGLIASNSLRAELAWMYAYCGAFERSLTLAEQALRYSREKQPAWIAFSQAAKARIHLLQGDAHAAAAAAGGARLEPITIPYARYTIFLCLANLELDVARGEFERALEYGRALLEETVPLTRVDVPELLRWNARALSGLGRFEQARQTLTEARRLAADTGTNLHLWPILADLAQVNVELGEVGQAEADRGAARRVIQDIAESLRALELRGSFLRLERVREVLN
jgi:tetratricopeptide (TPR) repeat protein